MNIKIKFPLEFGLSPGTQIHTLVVFVFFISWVICSFNIRIHEYRQSIVSLSKTNRALNTSLLQWDISYDECRCSVTSNKSNSSIQCITDVHDMAGHILPVVSFLLQLYITYEIFIFTGNYRHILRDIFWIIAVFVFIIIAMGACGSSRLYHYTSLIGCVTGFFLFCIFMYLIDVNDYRDSPYEHRNIDRDQRLVINNDDHEILISVTVYRL